MSFLWFSLLESKSCSVLCKGNYTTKKNDPAANCVAYNISFKVNKTLKSMLKDFQCKIPNCILELIQFECTFNKEYTEIYSNKTSISKEDQINQQDTNGKNRSSSQKEDNKNQQDTDGGNEPCIGNICSFSALY